MKKLIFLVTAITFIVLPMSAFAKAPVKVASKDFTEQVVLGKIMVALLEDRGILVEDRTSLGGTNVNRTALEQGQIDVYMEYTGTAWLSLFKKTEVVRDANELYAKVKAEDKK
ncbi:MAG: glycine/betaine ABC transporter substrate-binding protein, partial [Desulfobacula sp.]|nr:glycine/betaine ABC transporter substrate-binding protein [Desulfobacula sp.]